MVRYVPVLIFSSCLIALSCAGSFDGFNVFETVPTTETQVNFLRVLSRNTEVYDFFTLSKGPGLPGRVLVANNDEATFLDLLASHGLYAKVITDNVAAEFERELLHRRLQRTISPKAGNTRLSTDRYYTHAEINNYIEYLAQQFPTRVFLKTVGRSFEGRLLKTLTITNGDGRSNKNVVFMDGGFHAREWISPAATLYVLEQLVENFDENADLLTDYDWVVLPVVNPDGYEYTQTSTTARTWRKTRQPITESCIGTDPNRNFDFHWNEEGASSSPCASTYAGPTPFSEPETIVVRDIMHSLQGRGIMYLTLHSFGNYLLYPWGWTSDLPDTWEDLDEVARAGGDAIFEATGTKYSVGSSTNVLYIAAGASDDYAFYAGFPISITMELPGGGLTGFNPPASSIDPMVKETWVGIRAMAQKLVTKYPQQLKSFL